MNSTRQNTILPEIKIANRKNVNIHVKWVWQGKTKSGRLSNNTNCGDTNFQNKNALTKSALLYKRALYSIEASD